MTKAKSIRFRSWKGVVRHLDVITNELTEFREWVPDGISPPRFRAEVRRAHKALSRAIDVARARARVDLMRERRSAVSALRAKGLPDLPPLLPRRLRPVVGCGD